ncbi:MAG TPA: SCP2 sterol-binding domain-containing protein [Chthoniobacterales bacterium]|jgi:putative sterol carrier protein
MKNKFAIALLTIVLLFFAVSAEGAARHLGQDSVPQQVFDGMRQSFVPAHSKDVHVRYQFDLSGPNGGLWWIDVNDGKCQMGRGRIHDASVTFIATDRDWVAMSNGTLSGVWAYLTGRLKIHGDQKLARKLDEMFP